MGFQIEQFFYILSFFFTYRGKIKKHYVLLQAFSLKEALLIVYEFVFNQRGWR